MQHAAVPSAQKKRKTIITITLAALLLAAGAGGLWLVKTIDSGSGLLPSCLFHDLTGLYCTGCGITRALHLILNGHLWAGFRMNPLAVASLPMLIWFSLLMICRTIRGKPLPGMPLWVPWVILAVILVFSVARNLPWEPFSWLAPTELGFQ